MTAKCCARAHSVSLVFGVFVAGTYPLWREPCDIPTVFGAGDVLNVVRRAQGCLSDQGGDAPSRGAGRNKPVSDAPPLPPVSSRDDDESLSATPPSSCSAEGLLGSVNGHCDISFPVSLIF